MSLPAIQDHLATLVAFDTQNPPRQITAESGIIEYCSSVAGSRFRVKVQDHGDGHVSWFARTGYPKVLFNVHLDTVPHGSGWDTDPLELIVNDGRAVGRGACDIKGAAACLLHLAEQGAKNLAMLFTTDEEGADPCCVRNFLDSGEAERFEQVVVAEPTGCKAVLGHRGYLSVKTWFRGLPGHSSEARALGDNAIHQMSRWAAAALDLAETKKEAPADPGTCINIGLVEGGAKSNVIAAEAFMHWSARLQPGHSNDDFLEEVKQCAPETAETEWHVPFSGDPLPADGQDRKSAAAFAEASGMKIRPDVDFWTEASIFSAAGLPAVVLGPGHIEQAHVANEWVSLQQLKRALSIYGRVVESDG